MDYSNLLARGFVGLVIVLAFGYGAMWLVHYVLRAFPRVIRVVATAIVGMTVAIFATQLLYDTKAVTIEVEEVFSSGDVNIIESVDGEQYLHDTRYTALTKGDTYVVNISREFAGVTFAPAMIQSYVEVKDVDRETNFSNFVIPAGPYATRLQPVIDANTP